MAVVCEEAKCHKQIVEVLNTARMYRIFIALLTKSEGLVWVQSRQKDSSDHSKLLEPVLEEWLPASVVMKP